LKKYNTEIRALKDMDTEFRISCGSRLREERERLGQGQAEMSAATGVKPRTYQDWERGIASVSTEFLSLAATLGLDVMYVVTGVRTNEATSLDPLRRAVLASFNRCSPEKQIEAVQYMALLAAGVAPSQSDQTAKTVTKASVSKSAFGLAIGNVVGRKK
jgi:transcriptional regulator with XRE-family HTH domain